VLNLPYTFLWRPRSARIFLYLSKLATQMVTSTPLENLSLLLYEPQNKYFNFGTTKTLILHAWSIFFRGGHITKIWSKKIFFMKTLSKLGALTVYGGIYIFFLIQMEQTLHSPTQIASLLTSHSSGHFGDPHNLSHFSHSSNSGHSGHTISFRSFRPFRSSGHPSYLVIRSFRPSGNSGHPVIPVIPVIRSFQSLLSSGHSCHLVIWSFQSSGYSGHFGHTAGITVIIYVYVFVKIHKFIHVVHI
jgi:hypothetical protein